MMKTIPRFLALKELVVSLHRALLLLLLPLILSEHKFPQRTFWAIQTIIFWENPKIILIIIPLVPMYLILTQLQRQEEVLIQQEVVVVAILTQLLLLLPQVKVIQINWEHPYQQMFSMTPMNLNKVSIVSINNHQPNNNHPLYLIIIIIIIYKELEDKIFNNNPSNNLLINHLILIIKAQEQQIIPLLPILYQLVALINQLNNLHQDPNKAFNKVLILQLAPLVSINSNNKLQLLMLLQQRINSKKRFLPWKIL